MTSAIYSSPFALPAIALYAGCQTARNGYDAYRTFNKMLPENADENLSFLQREGHKKINQITHSKRKFYFGNTLGFAAFTAGATTAAVAAIAATWGGAALPIGIGLLSAGALTTGITNSIWQINLSPEMVNLGLREKKWTYKVSPQK